MSHFHFVFTFLHICCLLCLPLSCRAKSEASGRASQVKLNRCELLHWGPTWMDSSINTRAQAAPFSLPQQLCLHNTDKGIPGWEEGSPG